MKPVKIKSSNIIFIKKKKRNDNNYAQSMRIGESSDSATNTLKTSQDSELAKQKIFDKIKAISSQSGRNKMFDYKEEHEIIDPRQTLSSQKKLDFSALSRTDLSKDTNEG